MAATAGFVYLVDPFQVLRRSSGSPNFYAVEQFQIPGIARHYPYDAVVTGTSTSNNFRPADLAAAFGWNAVNFAIAGSTIGEQHAALDVALATGKARNIFWGLDPFAFRIDGAPAFPYYLYREPGWRTAPYFVSLGALMHGVATIALAEGSRTSLAQWTETRAWDGQYSYGRAQVLGVWANRRRLASTARPAAAALADRLVADQVSLVRANPSVQFRLVLLPYSILYQKLQLEDHPGQFEANCRLDAAIVDGVRELPNARVYNFRDAEDITFDLDAFKDLLHFSGDVSRKIVRDVAADRRRVSVDSLDRGCARLKAAAATYRVPLR